MRKRDKRRKGSCKPRGHSPFLCVRVSSHSFINNYSPSLISLLLCLSLLAAFIRRVCLYISYILDILNNPLLFLFFHTTKNDSFLKLKSRPLFAVGQMKFQQYQILSCIPFFFFYRFIFSL